MLATGASFVFFSATPTTDIYTLSLHDALPISPSRRGPRRAPSARPRCAPSRRGRTVAERTRSEEHTSELQSHVNLVCRLLLEKKKNQNISQYLCRKDVTALTSLNQHSV